MIATIVRERVHSAIDRPWSADEERVYLESLSPREAFHVAEHAEEGIVGIQSLDLWSPTLSSMAHVGQVGTFILRQWRGKGIARSLWGSTELFARERRYEKLVIQVRASNRAARSFYLELGFAECGRLARQVKIDGEADDEVLMELFLEDKGDSGAA